MGGVPESIRLAAGAAAARLREHAASPPDENLLSSIVTSGAVGDEFARAYAALRELGLEDKALDGFGVENASGGEMREAADLLEQLASSEDVPGPKVRGRRRISASLVRKHRIGAVLVALVFSLGSVLFGAIFLIRGFVALDDWHPRGPGTADRPAVAVPAPRPRVDRVTPSNPAVRRNRGTMSPIVPES